MGPTTWPILVLAGFAAGFINVVAGGGSLLTLPALLFAGLPAVEANATNRISLIFQNISATATFQRRGALAAKLAFKLTAVALPGALLGANLALELDERAFRRILAAIMIGVLALTLRGKGSGGPTAPARPLPLYISFFFMGIYAGFIQAGMGFLLIAALSGLGGLDLVRSNAVKVAVVLGLQIAALAVFQFAGTVDWAAGLALGAGSMTGAWAAARWQMKHGAIWVRRLLIVLLIAFALRLLQQSF